VIARIMSHGRFAIPRRTRHGQVGLRPRNRITNLRITRAPHEIPASRRRGTRRRLGSGRPKPARQGACGATRRPDTIRTPTVPPRLPSSNQGDTQCAILFHTGQARRRRPVKSASARILGPDPVRRVGSASPPLRKADRHGARSPRETPLLRRTAEAFAERLRRRVDLGFACASTVPAVSPPGANDREISADYPRRGVASHRKGVRAGLASG